MKKLFSVVCSVLLLSTLASGCSSVKTTAAKQPAANEKQVLNYWYPWGGDSEKWDKWRIGEFEKANPNITVNATYVPPDGGITNGKLLAAIAGGNPPDLVITSVYSSAYALAVQGALMPIDSALKKTTMDLSDILPTFLPLMKYKGTTYLFPQDSNVSLLYYNTDMFKEVGLDPNNPPKTIDELDADAQKLDKVNNGKIDRIGFIPWLDGGSDSYLWGWIFGANYYNSDTNKVDINNASLINTYKWMDTYAKRYNPEKIKSFSSAFGGAFSPDHPFFTGKVAMTVNGNWFATALKQYAPKLNYKVAAIPYPTGGRENATTFGTNVFMVPKGAKNVDAAAKFIAFAEKPEILADDLNNWRSIPIFSKSFSQVKLAKEGDAVYKVVQQVAESPNSGHPALTKVATQLGNDLNALRDDVIYNNKDPEPLLAALQAKTQTSADQK